MIKNSPMPRPAMPNFTLQTKNSQLKFSTTNYERFKWLVGCAESKAVFCWSCLLFCPVNKQSVWSSKGYSDLSNISHAMKKHDESQLHINCDYEFRTFGRTRINTMLDEQLAHKLSQKNIKVKQNREIMNRLIDATCYLAKQGLAFRGHDEKDDSINRGNYKELISLLGNYDPLLSNHLDTATVFSGLSKTIQNDLIKCVADCMTEKIQSEIKESDFIAIMVDETTDVSVKAQLSIVFRYVHNGKIHERFLKFEDVSDDKKAAAL